MEYTETYRGMSNEELLRIAIDSVSLEAPASIALTGELRRRSLSERDIAQYREHLASFKPEHFWGKEEKHLAFSMNGCGTSVYGKRDFDRNGSFVTTKWFVAFFVPLIPLASMRVKALGIDWLPFASARYLLIAEQHLSLKQVACVYSYLLCLFLSLRAAESLRPTGTVVVLTVVVLVPWTLRRLARAKARNSHS